MDKCTDCLFKQYKVLDTPQLKTELVCEIDGMPAEGRLFCAADYENGDSISDVENVVPKNGG